MQHVLVMTHPVLHHHGDIAPLLQPGILILELQIFLIDHEEFVGG